MVVRGRVRNSVVVLENGVRLPEGQEVIVLASDVASAILPINLRAHSILDIPAVSVGAALSALGSDEDVLGEMLEGRP
jgi:hypothetical protein